MIIDRALFISTEFFPIPLATLSMTNQNMTTQQIGFCRPDTISIHKEGKLPVDMHLHSQHSDAPTSVATLLKLAKRKGIGLALTDHNEISGSLKALREAPSSVPIIPGIEVSAADGPHILVYFFDAHEMEEWYFQNIKPAQRPSPYLAIRLDTEAILDSCEGVNCMVSGAHPYGYYLFNKGVGRCWERGYLRREVLERLDGLEVICGGMSRKTNLQAIHLAEQLGLPGTGGTDAHLWYDVGRVVTVATVEDPVSFLEETLKGRTSILGMEKHAGDKIMTGAAMIPQYLPYTLSSLGIHYEQNIPRIRHAIRKWRKGN